MTDEPKNNTPKAARLMRAYGFAKKEEVEVCEHGEGFRCALCFPDPLSRAKAFYRENEADIASVVDGLHKSGWSKEDATADADQRFAKYLERLELSEGLTLTDDQILIAKRYKGAVHDVALAFGLSSRDALVRVAAALSVCFEELEAKQSVGSLFITLDSLPSAFDKLGNSLLGLSDSYTKATETYAKAAEKFHAEPSIYYEKPWLRFVDAHEARKGKRRGRPAKGKGKR